MTFNSKLSTNKGFTLLELLIVIGILAILSTVVILVINPVEYLKQSRDAERFSDMDNLNKALSLYQLNGQSMGTSNTVYVSIPDTVSTCANLGLPTLPTGYSYYCSTSANFKNTDGTGWIPLNFKALSGGSPIGFLPADPVNSVSSRNYYAYSTNGTNYEITAAPESSKFKLGGSNDKVSTDGGNKMSLYELGSNLTLEPADYGDSSLVGFWHMDNNWNDSSSNRSDGTANGGATFTSAAKVGTAAGSFDGTSGNITLGGTPFSFNLNQSATFGTWLKTSVGSGGIFTKANMWGPGYDMIFSGGIIYYYIAVGSTADKIMGVKSASAINDGLWHYVAFSYDGSGLRSGMKIYIDGADVTLYSEFSSSVSGSIINIYNLILGYTQGWGFYFNGLFDEVRIYNRALSASEVAAIYNANK